MRASGKEVHQSIISSNMLFLFPVLYPCKAKAKVSYYPLSISSPPPLDMLSPNFILNIHSAGHIFQLSFRLSFSLPQSPIFIPSQCCIFSVVYPSSHLRSLHLLLPTMHCLYGIYCPPQQSIISTFTIHHSPSLAIQTQTSPVVFLLISKTPGLSLFH